MFSSSNIFLSCKMLVLKHNLSRASSNLTNISFINGVKTITMCDQQSRNSLSLSMMLELHKQITENENDSKLRTIIVAAEGNIFSAGHNLKELTSQSGITQHRQVFNLATKLMLSIINCPVPVIAKVDGLAAAAGCQLVAQCDLAFCTERSTFSTPGVNLGIFCSTPGIALARVVPKTTAMHMLLTGQPITSLEAKNNGLVYKVCSSCNDLDEEIEKTCQSILVKSRSVIELGKKFFYQQIQENVKAAYEIGEEKMVENLELHDAREGIKSFAEKRKANWLHTFDK